MASAVKYPAFSTRPERKAPLMSAGRVLGWVWTDDVEAAGWDPVEQSQEAAQAAGRVWTIHAAAARGGEPVSVVLEPERYAPLYQLGDPVT